LLTKTPRSSIASLRLSSVFSVSDSVIVVRLRLGVGVEVGVPSTVSAASLWALVDLRGVADLRGVVDLRVKVGLCDPEGPVVAVLATSRILKMRSLMARAVGFEPGSAAKARLITAQDLHRSKSNHSRQASATPLQSTEMSWISRIFARS
jgi:hypothetical protein